MTGEPHEQLAPDETATPDIGLPRRIQYGAQILGYVGAAFFGLDLVWVLIAPHLHFISDIGNAITMMFFSSIAVVCIIVAVGCGAVRIIIGDSRKRDRAKMQAAAELHKARSSEITEVVRAVGSLAAAVRAVSDGQAAQVDQFIQLRSQVGEFIEVASEVFAERDRQIEDLRADLRFARSERANLKQQIDQLRREVRGRRPFGANRKSGSRGDDEPRYTEADLAAMADGADVVPLPRPEAVALVRRIIQRELNGKPTPINGRHH